MTQTNYNLSDKAYPLERNIIASILYDSEKVKYVQLQGITAEHFTNSYHKEIWQSIVAVASRQKNIHPAIIAAELGDNKIVDELQQMIQSMPIPKLVYIETSVAELIRLHTIHETWKLGITLQSMAETGKIDSDTIYNAIKETQQQTKHTKHPELLQDIFAIPKEQRKQKTYKTGYPRLDALTGGIPQGGITVLAGYTHSGKSRMTLAILGRIASTKKKVRYYALECSSYIFADYIEQMSGGYEPHESCYQYMSIIDRFSRIKDILLDAEVNNAQVIAIDYAQIVDVGEGSLFEQMRVLARELTEFTRRTNIAVVLLSQVPVEGAKGGIKKEAVQAKGGGDIMAASSLFLLLERKLDAKEDERNDRKLYVTKNRNGRTGDITMEYVYQHAGFTDDVLQDVF